MLVIAILGFFGVQTTSLAALIAAAGIAIGMAWSGLLANFAAGVFLVILQPFKVGDFVTAGGIMGTVHEVGLFVTYIDTLDNVRHIVGNGKIFGRRDPELLHQRLPQGGPDGATGARRRCARCHGAAEEGAGRHSERREPTPLPTSRS